MRRGDTLLCMSTQGRRQLAGELVRDEIARKTWTHQRAAEAMGLSRSGLVRVLKGEDNVTELTLRQIEGALSMPRYLLTYVVNGDVAQIKRIDDMDSDLKRHILNSLEGGARSVRGARKAQGA